MIQVNAAQNPAIPPDKTTDELRALLWQRVFDVTTAHDDLLAILREALKEAEEKLDDGERFLEPSCNECTEGSTPHRFDRGLCWVHKARKLIGEAQ